MDNKQNSFLQDNDGVTTVTKADDVQEDRLTSADFEFRYLNKLILEWEELRGASMQGLTMTEQLSHRARIRLKEEVVTMQISEMMRDGLIPAMEPHNG